MRGGGARRARWPRHHHRLHSLRAAVRQLASAGCGAEVCGEPAGLDTIMSALFAGRRLAAGFGRMRSGDARGARWPRHHHYMQFLRAAVRQPASEFGRVQATLAARWPRNHHRLRTAVRQFASAGRGAAVRGKLASLDIIVCILCGPGGPAQASGRQPGYLCFATFLLPSSGWVGGAGGLVVWATAGSQAFQSPRKAW